MALVIPSSGKLELLDKMLKDALSDDENYILKLFINDVIPNESSVVDTFVEANFTGYSSKTLTRAGWKAAAIVANKAQSNYSQQSWTCGLTGNTVYGYYLIGSNSNVLLWAERFDSPRVLVNTDTLNVTPVFTLNSEN
jgi:hypothetical protein